MDLLLWRHAEAEDGFPDEARKLTPRGEKQAKQMAKWLNKHAPKDLRIIASPALRCQQTTQALGRPFETDTRLSTSGNASTLLTVAGWPDGDKQNFEKKISVLIVGHQPTLGRTSALLLAGAETDWAIKKGAVWWFSKNRQRLDEQTVLQAVLSPAISA